MAGRLIRIPIGLLATPVIPVRTRETECYKLIGLVAGIQYNPRASTDIHRTEAGSRKLPYRSCLAISFHTGVRDAREIGFADSLRRLESFAAKRLQSFQLPASVLWMLVHFAPLDAEDLE